MYPEPHLRRKPIFTCYLLPKRLYAWAQSSCGAMRRTFISASQLIAVAQIGSLAGRTARSAQYLRVSYSRQKRDYNRNREWNELPLKAGPG
ncbi:hypothetical protein EVAR_57278_1 [Eumeta japonica]|uniref:Uncharacterized protein n=1 Tax=Eumeta variegata TaxID=151549 RepID=A0A4C1ZYU3_EUMVA|nr:hypothetical protein EVAR_57278_1 [Eumeta japonica]